MLRSVLGTGLLVTVYRAAFSKRLIIWWGEPGERPSIHKVYRAERIKTDNKTISNVKFFQIFIKTFLKIF